MDYSRYKGLKARVKKYRYLLTIARRGGADNVIFRLIANRERDVLEVPVPPDIGGEKVEEYIKNSICGRQKPKRMRMGRYLGSRIKEKGGEKTRYFLFSCEFLE